MKWTGLNELRESYLRFFESKGHTRMASAPLVPRDDNSLLLINSGMAPLKKFFTGQATPPNTRVTTCQKCIRTPDIENVGKTARHGTYFEMLGNFSFGDYFKREATAWAWEYLTQVLEIPVDRLWVTIYEDDDEAFDIWTKEVGVAPERVVRMGKKDNFWEHGTGPCGPCSELHYDRGPEYGCGKPTCGVGCDCDRYMEVWNLVFTQFDSDGEGHYARLAKPNIDTGMGLERLACVMQGVNNLFEVDTVQNIMKHVSQIANVSYGQDEKTDISLRVITDHIRSTTFMVGDGITPSNEGRGYVLRRLLRRAARHGRILGIHRPFLYEVCDTVIQENRTAYPELAERATYIKKIVRAEEENFGRTVDKGFELLNSLIDRLEERGMEKGGILSGEDAFRLYDTFGFPLDLTKEIIAEKNLEVDEDAFRQLMDEQRRRAREARTAADNAAWSEDALAPVKDRKSSFVGYDQLSAEAEVIAMVRDGELVDSIAEGDEAIVVLDTTPFYAESGGQVGDTGRIVVNKNIFQVTDCKKSPTGHSIHIGRMSGGFLTVGDRVTAAVDADRRRAIMRNHTACHLLQAALRRVLGDHVHQAGSYVDDKRCRFDFSHFSAVTAEELRQVERSVNRAILSALPVAVKSMPIEQARKLGAMALFGEKYGDIVRVCDVTDFSREFCGGTHVDNTSKIGLFKILSESSVAAGVRRIEATTGLGVLELLEESQQTVAKAAETLKVANHAELVSRCAAVMAELKEKERALAALEQKVADSRIQGLFENAQTIGRVRFISAAFSGTKPETLRMMGDKIREQAPNVVAVLLSVNEGKATLLAVCGKEAIASGMHAGKILKEAVSAVGGSGGGRPESAMGGVPDPLRADEAVQQVPAILEKMAK